MCQNQELPKALGRKLRCESLIMSKIKVRSGPFFRRGSNLFIPFWAVESSSLIRDYWARKNENVQYVLGSVAFLVYAVTTIHIYGLFGCERKGAT